MVGYFTIHPYDDKEDFSFLTWSFPNKIWPLRFWWLWRYLNWLIFLYLKNYVEVIFCSYFTSLKCIYEGYFNLITVLKKKLLMMEPTVDMWTCIDSILQMVKSFWLSSNVNWLTVMYKLSWYKSVILLLILTLNQVKNVHLELLPNINLNLPGKKEKPNYKPTCKSNEFK